jgi:hypothetical protein
MKNKKMTTDTINDFTIASCGTGGGSNSTIVNYETILEDFGNASRYDAFNRFRISTPFTLFDSHNRYRRNNKFNEACVGAGSTAIYRVNESSVDLVVGTGASAEIIQESKNKIFLFI